MSVRGFKGGQGRDDEEIPAAGMAILATTVCAVAAWIILWLLIKWAVV